MRPKVLRVAMVVFNEVQRGTFFRAFGLARGLAARGHHVSVLAMARERRWRPKRYREGGVEVVAFPDWLWGSLRSGWDPIETGARIAWLRGQHFDIIHAFECRPTVLLPALIAQRARNTRLVMDWCDWFGRGGSVEMRPNPVVRALLRPVETWFEERFRTWADATTVINRVLWDKAVALGVQPSSILMLPNGADRHRLRPLPKLVARQQLGLEPDRPLIGYLGSAFPADLRLMAAALEQLHVRLPEAQLLRLGQHTYGLDQHLAESGVLVEPGRWLSDEELNRYLAACDLFWLPLVNVGANQGRWPAKLTDYLCVGRPIVATRVGDLTALFESYPLGRLADDTPDDVVAQTLHLLADKGARVAAAQASQVLVQERFDWNRLAEQLEALYRRALQTPG